MNKCPKCGTTSRIREKDNFCYKCGCNLYLGKIKEAVKEVLQGSEVETVETRYITGERRIITLLDGKENSNVVIGAETKKKDQEALEWLKEYEQHLLSSIDNSKIRMETLEKQLRSVKYLAGQLEGQPCVNCPKD